MYRLSLIYLLAATCIGCTANTTRTEQRAEQTPVKPSADVASTAAEYVESGRYTLVKTAPRPEQVDLLQQIIEIQIPVEQTSTVRSAMQHVLQRTGYKLCAESPSQKILFSRPLPAAHYHLGPMSLSNALQVLAGTSWALQRDDVFRTVCFERKVAKP